MNYRNIKMCLAGAQKSNPACVMQEINLIKDKPVTDIKTPAELSGNAEERHIK